MELQIKQCQNCKSTFSIAPDDFSFYEKIKVPPPTFCPPCRFQRQLMFRNERNLYRRTCDLCKKSIIAVYPADALFPVYCQKCWWSDNWDPTVYNRDVDFSRPFFEQIKELFWTVPQLSIQNDDGIGSVNSEYAYDWAFSKNVYLSVCGWYVENGLYLFYACYDKDVMDCYFVNHSQLTYESVNCNKCYQCAYCTLCFDCTDCILGYDLRGCSHCVMCVGLRNKNYCILNQQYTKEAYEEKCKELGLEYRSHLEKAKKEFADFALQFPRKYMYGTKTINCTGNILVESKNSHDCFYVLGLENCRFIVGADHGKETYDCNNTGNPELCYEGVTPDNSRGNKFTIFCWKCTEAEYSNNCHSCTSVFGSTGLKHTSYAILNKRYSKEEYISLREKIIEHVKKNGEWGEFFSHALSPFAYDETAAIEWFPLSQEQALARGYRWLGKRERNYTITKKPEELPETIAEVSDSIVGAVIECAHGGTCGERCTTAFKIVEAELQLYRKMNIPLPQLCPNCRHYARLQVRPPAKLWYRQCQCKGQKSDVRGQMSDVRYTNTATHFHGTEHCPNTFQTSYSPDRKDIVYCEQCYNAEVV